MKPLKDKNLFILLFSLFFVLAGVFLVQANDGGYPNKKGDGSCQNPNTVCSHVVTSDTANEYIDRVYAKADPTAGTVEGNICVSGGVFSGEPTRCSSYNNNSQSGDGIMTIAGGPGYHHSLFDMTNSGGTGATSWEHWTDFVFRPPVCSPSSQNVQPNQTASFTALLGNYNYSWSAPGGNPSSGTGNGFSTSYSSSGTKTVTVTSAGMSDTCTVEVSSQWVNLNFIVKDNCGSGWPISGATITIDQDFGNGTTRTTGSSGFENFGVNANTNIGWGVSKSGYNSASGSVNSGSGTTVQVTLTGGSCSGPPPPPPPPGCQGDCAQYISQQNVPTAAGTGQSFSVSITMKNVGTTTWTSGDQYKLGSQNPENNTTWGLSRVNVPSTVSPGQQVTFNFNPTAPASPGNYNFQWRMLREGVQWFGDFTPNTAINVTSGGGPPPPPPPPPGSCTDNSSTAFTNPIPGTLNPGQTVSFTIRVTDTGDTRWYHGSAYQFLQQSALSISPSYGHLPRGVYPGDQVDWTFNLTAPSSPGTYTLNMRMIHNAGAEYIKPDGATCPAPSSDTYFGQTATRTFNVSQPLPTTSDVVVTLPNYCVSGPAATVGWSYSDSSGRPQSAYQVQIDEQPSFSNPEIDSGKVICQNCRSYFSGTGILQFNTTYGVRVRTWNNYDVQSTWQEATSCIGEGCQPNGKWKTPSHAYPNVNSPYQFTWSPANPAANSPIQFNDRTLFDPSSNNKVWSWTFVPAGGGPGSSTAQNPAYAFNSEGVYQVTERVRDNALPPGQYCTGPTQAVNIQKPIPIWKEIAPR